jgi:signal peptidase I
MKTRISTLLLALVLIAASGCRDAVQPSSAMAPTIKPGERVTVDFLAYLASRPRRWDVVAFERPASSGHVILLKRVLALPNETISLTSTGIVVNGGLMPLPAPLSNVVYCPPDKLPAKYTAGLVRFPYVVPPKHYFVVGDNWADSYDSRHYGAIPATDVVGRVKDK